MAEILIPQRSEGMRCLLNLIITFAIVICASVVSMLALNVSAVVQIGVLVLAAIFALSFFVSRQRIKETQQTNGERH